MTQVDESSDPPAPKEGSRPRRQTSSRRVDLDGDSSSDEEAVVDQSNSPPPQNQRIGDMGVPLSETLETDEYHMSSKNENSGQGDHSEERLREKLEKNLQEEQMLVSLQMQLLTQLERLNASIAEAESEERLAKLAIQQGQITRALKKCQNPDADVDEEAITVQLR